MPITLAQLKDRLQELFAGADTTDPTGLQGKFLAVQGCSIEDYDQLDEEAKSYIDNGFAALKK